HPTTPLFPYTTLFRSLRSLKQGRLHLECSRVHVVEDRGRGLPGRQRRSRDGRSQGDTVFRHVTEGLEARGCGLSITNLVRKDEGLIDRGKIDHSIRCKPDLLSVSRRHKYS